MKFVSTSIRMKTEVKETTRVAFYFAYTQFSASSLPKSFVFALPIAKRQFSQPFYLMLTHANANAIVVSQHTLPTIHHKLTQAKPNSVAIVVFRIFIGHLNLWPAASWLWSVVVCQFLAASILSALKTWQSPPRAYINEHIYRNRI